MSIKLTETFVDPSGKPVTLSYEGPSIRDVMDLRKAVNPFYVDVKFSADSTAFETVAADTAWAARQAVGRSA